MQFDNENLKLFLYAFYLYQHDPNFRASFDACFDLAHPDPCIVYKLRAFFNDGKLFTLRED